MPEIVAARCRALMARLGLVFGCFDFIVTESGDWVYLEVNEMGQFLFLEAWCPEHVLDAFCTFLVSGNPSFTYEVPKNPVRFAALSADGELARRLKEAGDRDALPANRATSAFVCLVAVESRWNDDLILNLIEIRSMSHDGAGSPCPKAPPTVPSE